VSQSCFASRATPTMAYELQQPRQRDLLDVYTGRIS
jgi:hypothetical protein